ncbi:hypothetical protein ESOMN_v1c03750 [Williamsoniiplasma somnilux]|uniref:Lipoprotein n=1 Tax=Williamsoniiplasma somnilux TaxID=215578 RepID=A0A2K8NY94_9MOLU|nr:lipoprotein [Williamsoniiplasma somnilux]ATZ18757.1 hypothetical protein ESOMN_v1c03750 [Williamsoniiplasma somnilux]
MKKLLGLIGSISLIATTSFTVVSCGVDKKIDRNFKDFTKLIYDWTYIRSYANFYEKDLGENKVSGNKIAVILASFYNNYKEVYDLFEKNKITGTLYSQNAKGDFDIAKIEDLKKDKTQTLYLSIKSNEKEVVEKLPINYISVTKAVVSTEKNDNYENSKFYDLWEAKSPKKIQDDLNLIKGKYEQLVKIGEKKPKDVILNSSLIDNLIKDEFLPAIRYIKIQIGEELDYDNIVKNKEKPKYIDKEMKEFYEKNLEEFGTIKSDILNQIIYNQESAFNLGNNIEVGFKEISEKQTERKN